VRGARRSEEGCVHSVEGMGGGGGALFELELGGHSLLRVARNDPSNKLPPEAHLNRAGGHRKFSNRRKVESSSQEDVSLALVNCGLFGNAARRNSELLKTLEFRAEASNPRPPPPAELPPQVSYEIEESPSMPESHLHIAVKEGHGNSVRFLLEQDTGDLNSHDSEGNTPLHLALESGQEVVSMLLMQHGADVTASNSFGRTPLHFAALQGMEQVLSRIVCVCVCGCANMRY